MNVHLLGHILRQWYFQPHLHIWLFVPVECHITKQRIGSHQKLSWKPPMLMHLRANRGEQIACTCAGQKQVVTVSKTLGKWITLDFQLRYLKI